VRWVATNWAGVDTVIGAPIFKAGDVALTSAAGVHAVNMAEYTLMMMLALAHRLPNAFRMMQHGAWPPDGEKSALFMPSELRGATLGLIGYGWIGKEIARLAQAFGMSVIVCRRTPGEGAGQEAEGGAAITFVARERLYVLLRASDFLVLAAPITPETRGMIDARALRAMKSTAFLVNIGRGDVVDEPALIEALRGGGLAGAALDVFHEEPLPGDSPLWALENVIMTPHIAGHTPNYEARAADIFAENLRRFVAGQPLINQVDFARGY
jgi:phosphoglycerate dehydrogenase-like enzyme